MPGKNAADAALTLSSVGAMADFTAGEWDALANPPTAAFDPFVSHDFLNALEQSGCASPRTGWSPRHLAVRASDGSLVAAAPLYLKDHSRGEFVFDHSWADALERAGGRYYPKLLCAVPFTPVTGRRLMTSQDHDATSLRRTLVSGMIETARVFSASSCHLNFLEEATAAELADNGLLARSDQQFHWLNRGYASFDDFLSALTSRKRKMIRKERSCAMAGLRIERLTGPDLTESAWDAFYRFYIDTGGRKWGSPYLNRRFFSLLNERMADKVLLVIAWDGDTPIAGALNLIGSEAIYGRYWGRVVDRPFLHFEICYYQAIEFAIERGLARVEAGAQGEHKLARGYEPVLTRSAHWIAHPGLSDAVRRYLDRERDAVVDHQSMLAEFTPFRKADLSNLGQQEEEEGV